MRRFALKVLRPVRIDKVEIVPVETKSIGLLGSLCRLPILLRHLWSFNGNLQVHALWPSDRKLIWYIAIVDTITDAIHGERNDFEQPIDFVPTAIVKMSILFYL